MLFLSNQDSRSVDVSDSAVPITNFMSIFTSVLKTSYKKDIHSSMSDESIGF